MIIDFNTKEKKFKIDLLIDDSLSEDEIDQSPAKVNEKTVESSECLNVTNQDSARIIRSQNEVAQKSSIRKNQSFLKKTGKLAKNSAKLSRKLFQNSKKNLDSALKQSKNSKAKLGNLAKPVTLPKTVNPNDVYFEFDKILGTRERNGKRQAKIKWSKIGGVDSKP